MTTPSMRIAFLGIGLMGKPMVRRLAEAGHRPNIWNRTPEKAKQLADIATPFADPNAAVADTDIVISMLADGASTKNILDSHGVISAAKTGALIINMGSVEPELDIALAQQARKQGKRYLDAPVSGGVPGAESGSLTILIGGEQSDMEYARPVFELFGRPNWLGETGAGQTAKLANQLIVAVTIGAVAEAFHMAEQAGVNLANLREALMGGFADSRVLTLHGERMVKQDFVPGGRSWSQLKDIRNALSVANEHALSLPLAECAQSGFDSLVNEYDGADLDHSAYYLWLKKRHQKTKAQGLEKKRL